ncbi:hypothetical protein GUITHDRAFT_93546 [Guillardia theta CCMP2712]|uniref:diacylglycerol O-acyltransferase n=1 Tax=Guillardia theta (strain CCMP2712) TaxID=905079 RepID=L1JL23_GUITC|nr:hypothetical protein GUITHDRAFT_93546 [Guillardia theta CCMP2712]EKX48765.1 hypothetical protein GUITHDRAFT_93546 [Guillardia theta CCMP2712]|eukprot:XP_005835745.1 hypothetical protein GUITHDRAFT_93546 [Guillardia theta CCMP2712]
MIRLSRYRYFSYRIVWTNDAMELARSCPAWVGAAGPHGVMPFANVLSIPAINSFVGRKFKGATASVLKRVPFLRLLYLFGCVDVSSKTLTKTLKEGYCVGLVSDGIAGIFKCSKNEETLYLANRKSLAKFCLKNGCPLIPAFSVGNSEAFSLWFDSFGILEWLSRKAQTAVFVFWGRFFLPIPRRVNITLLFGSPIMVERKEHPTQEDIDELHNRLLAATKTMYDAHKHKVGKGHKELKII